ncbi:MAG: MerR family transcriptional regulator [Elusimicrobiota bacterium]
MGQSFTIGRIAKLAGASIQTIRYYERCRLLLPNGRTESGYRLYTEEAVQKLRFIKNAQGLGFSLAEIARLLRLRVSSPAQCGKTMARVKARLEVVQGKISGLRAIEKTLRLLIRTCAARGTSSSCPILKSLEIKTGGNNGR